MPKRVEFSFDDRSLESLSKMVRQGRAPLPMPKDAGEYVYKEIEVTNPETGETRVIVIPDRDRQQS